MANRSVLPRDLIVEILSRLPVKSLMRFKAVCRGWSALISRSSFISAHLGRSNRKSSLLLTFRGCYGAETHGISLLDEGEGDDDEVGMLKNQDLPFQANRKSDMLSIVGCCNGLVCVSLEKDGADCVLWNPATRQYRRFPAPLIPAVPNHCYVRWGFGFHPDTCDHMLLRIVQSFDGQKPPFCRDSSKYTIRTEIFTLSTGSWREISGIPPCIFNDYGVALVLKGVQHWIVNEGSGRSDGDFVLSFDMGTLQFSRMEVPPNRGVYEVKKLLEFQQMLAMLTLNVGSNSIYHMWTMKSGSWTKLFVYGPFPGPVLTVGVWRNCKLLVSTALMEEGDDITLHNSHLLLFDPIRKITREVSKDSVQSFYEGGTYVESLLSVYTGF